MEGYNMNEVDKLQEEDHEMAQEYDFGQGVRGKYAERLARLRNTNGSKMRFIEISTTWKSVKCFHAVALSVFKAILISSTTQPCAAF
jgi:hypothetical protein